MKLPPGFHQLPPPDTRYALEQRGETLEKIGILQALSKREATVKKLSQQLGRDESTLARHIRALAPSTSSKRKTEDPPPTRQLGSPSLSPKPSTRKPKQQKNNGNVWEHSGQRIFKGFVLGLETRLKTPSGAGDRQPQPYTERVCAQKGKEGARKEWKSLKTPPETDNRRDQEIIESSLLVDPLIASIISSMKQSRDSRKYSYLAPLAKQIPSQAIKRLENSTTSSRRV